MIKNSTKPTLVEHNSINFDLLIEFNDHKKTMKY